MLGLNGITYGLPIMNQIQIRLLINVFCPSAWYVEGIQILKFWAIIGHMIDISAHLSKGNSLLKHGLRVMKFIFKNLPKYHTNTL